MASVGTTVGTGGLISSGGALFTGPGSLAYDMMLAAAMQRQMYQARQASAATKQAKRAANLAKRQYNAESTRAATLVRRERMREFLAAQNGGSKALTEPRLLASSSANRY